MLMEIGEMYGIEGLKYFRQDCEKPRTYRADRRRHSLVLGSIISPRVKQAAWPHNRYLTTIRIEKPPVYHAPYCGLQPISLYMDWQNANITSFSNHLDIATQTSPCTSLSLDVPLRILS